MNLNSSPTLDELSALISTRVDEMGHHVLWVDSNGEVHLTRLPDDLTPLAFSESQKSMKMRCETFDRGSGYVGNAAAKDSRFITPLFKLLVEGWETSASSSMIKYLG